MFNGFIRYERRYTFRDRTNFRAICLVDFGAARSAIHHALSNDALHSLSARIALFTPSSRGAVPEIKFGKITMQMLFGAMLIRRLSCRA